MIGLIDVGGGMRGVYTAGVYDALLDTDVSFDCVVAVSAGTANAATFLARQKGRCLRFYEEYSFRKEYMSLGNLIKKGSYLDLDYIYGDLSFEGGEDPFDFARFEADHASFFAVATDARTGRAVYFDKSSLRPDDLAVLKASCNVPIVGRPVFIDGAPYFDGGVSDPIPFKKAFYEGCDRIVVLLTRPVDFNKPALKTLPVAKTMYSEFPAFCRAMELMNGLYNSQLEELRSYAAAGRAYICAPEDTFGMETLTKDKTAMRRLYEEGLADAAGIAEFMKG